MSETVELFRAMRDHTKALRAKYGVACPRCAKGRSRAHPPMLLPLQRCRVGGAIDPRPELTDTQWRETPLFKAAAGSFDRTRTA